MIHPLDALDVDPASASPMDVDEAAPHCAAVTANVGDATYLADVAKAMAAALNLARVNQAMGEESEEEGLEEDGFDNYVFDGDSGSGSEESVASSDEDEVKTTSAPWSATSSLCSVLHRATLTPTQTQHSRSCLAPPRRSSVWVNP